EVPRVFGGGDRSRSRVCVTVQRTRHVLRNSHDVRHDVGERGNPLIRASVESALRLDPTLPEAHGTLGIVAGALEHNWTESARRFGFAMARDPIPGQIHQWFGYFYLLPVGKLGEAVAEAELALRDDPLNLTSRFGLAASLLAADREEE